AMLIRKPVADVFNAFVDPAITSNFWFSKGNAKLAPGEIVRWDWEMYNFGVDVYVLEMEPPKRLLLEWSGAGAPTNLEFTFDARPDHTTFVTITNSGFSGTADEMVDQALGSVEGFTFVLAGLKA